MQCHARAKLGFLLLLLVAQQTAVDFFCQIAEAAAQIGAGASGVLEIAVLGQVAAGIARIIEAGGQRRVALADVHTQRDQGLKGRVADVPVAADLIVGDLNRDSPVIVLRAAAAPTAISLVAEQRNVAIAGDGVVAGHPAGRAALDLRNLFEAQITRHVVGRDLGNRVPARAVAVGRDRRIGNQPAITHRPLPPFRRTIHPRPRRSE